jgi:hypothetical protein
VSKKPFMFAGVNAAYVVNADGTQHPLPSVISAEHISRSKGADKVYHLGDIDLSMSFEVPISEDNRAFFDELFKVTEPDRAYRLDSATGRVLIDGRRVSVNGKPLPAQWHYVNIVDRAVWRWALRTGLQLEDAVAELNRLAEKGKP